MTRRPLLLALFATALWGAGAQPAQAHLGLESSEPGNAAAISDAPDTARLTWDGDVDIETAEAQLRYLGDVDTPISEATRRDVRTEALPVIETNGRTAVFDLPQLDDGLYAIDWAVNELGGHDNSSFILFKVDGGNVAGGDAALLVVAGLSGLVLVTGAVVYSTRRRKADK